MIKINCHLADSENLIIKCNHCKIVATIIRDGQSMVALDERSNKLATIYFDDRNHRIYVEAECYPRKIIFSKRLGCNDNFCNKIAHFRLLNEICQHIDLRHIIKSIDKCRISCYNNGVTSNAIYDKRRTI